MGIVRVSAIVLVVVTLLSPVVSASGLEGLGVGTRATALGGAFRAVADDWTAAFYNPAGYANIYDNQLGANLGLVHFRNEITPNYRWGGVYETGVLNDQVGYNDHSIQSMPAGGFIVRLPFWGETVFGLSAYQQFDYNVTWKLYEHRPEYNGYDAPALPDNQYENNFDVVSFQLTAAREFVENKLSLGVGLQVNRGDLNYTSPVFRDNPYLERDPNWEFADYPNDKIVQWISNDGNGWSFAIRAGMLLKQSEKLSLALTANVPFNITISGRSALEFYMPEGQVLPNTYSPGSVEYLMVSGDKITDSADFETSVKLPPTVGFGMAFQASEKLQLSLDAEYTFWSSFEGFDFEYTEHSGFGRNHPADTAADMATFFKSDISVPIDWSDAIKVMAGASYDLSEKFTLMAGASMDQSPTSEDEMQIPQIVDLGTKWGLNAGFIVHIQQWDLGLATSYISQPDEEVASLTDINGDGIMDNFAGSYKADTYQTTLSINYRF